TFSRPTISIARRIAAYARTVEPCSANLTKRIRSTWRGPGGPADSKILRRRVKIAQSGAPTQRSVHCKVEMPAGRSIFWRFLRGTIWDKLCESANVCESFSLGKRWSFHEFYARK